MYPSMEQPRYSTDHILHPTAGAVPSYPAPYQRDQQPSRRYSTDINQAGGSPFPVSGIPNPNDPQQVFHFGSYNTYSSTTPTSSAPPLVSPPGYPWSTGLCHCCDDPANCLITAFCPCITFGQIAEILNKGQSTCTESGTFYGLLLAVSGFACFYSCFYRSKMRAQYDLMEEPCGDCLVHFCCETCALCQEYRELKLRGFDMGIGWEANVDRQKRAGFTVPPIVVPGMTR